MPVFSFLNPAFLWALPAAAIPIVIHLLSRRRLPEVSFPTTQFLRDLEPQEIRRLRLREILLLILRTLAILLLVLAFARPSLTPHNTVAHSAAAVAILIDDSESMAALEEQARPRIEIAKERAAAILEAARPGDEISIATSTRPDANGAGHTTDRVRLKRALERVEATSLPAKMAAAILEARRALQRSRLQARELYVISDLQRANFAPEVRAEIAAAAGAGVRVYLVPLVQGRVPNHAFQDVDPQLRPGPEGRGLELRARFANHADAPSDRVAIRVRRGDALIGGGDITLRSDEVRWVSMPLDWRGAPDAAGSAGPVILESDQDALPADDRWYAALGAPRSLRVLRIAEARDGTPPPRFAALALDPGGDGTGGFTAETGTPASLLSLSRSRTDVVLLEDVASLSADAEAKLRTFLRDGGGLVVALGPHSDPDYYSAHLFQGLIDLALEGTEQAAEGAPFELKARIPGHDVLEGITVGVGSTLTQSRPRSSAGALRPPARRSWCRRQVVFRSSRPRPEWACSSAPSPTTGAIYRTRARSFRSCGASSPTRRALPRRRRPARSRWVSLRSRDSWRPPAPRSWCAARRATHRRPRSSRRGRPIAVSPTRPRSVQASMYSNRGARRSPPSR